MGNFNITFSTTSIGILKSKQHKCRLTKNFSYLQVENVLVLSQLATFSTLPLIVEALSNTSTIKIEHSPNDSSSSVSGSIVLILLSISILYTEITPIIGVAIGQLTFLFLNIRYFTRVFQKDVLALGEFPGSRAWLVSIAVLAFFLSDAYFQVLKKLIS